jgi:hypothetical protein
VVCHKTTQTICEWFDLKTCCEVFAGLASKPIATVFSSLASKLVATVSLGLASKPEVGFLVEPQNQGGRRFSRFGPQNRQLCFGDLGLKISATVSWFRPQNQVGFGLSVAPQNRRREIGVGHASRSSGLLGVEASLARVSHSGLKTGGGAMMGGVRGTIVKVASEAS